MVKGIAIALLVIGGLLIVYGISASQSIGSEISEAVTGTPTDRTIWLLVGGIGSAIVGLVMLLKGGKAT